MPSTSKQKRKHGTETKPTLNIRIPVLDVFTNWTTLLTVLTKGEEWNYSN